MSGLRAQNSTAAFSQHPVALCAALHEETFQSLQGKTTCPGTRLGQSPKSSSVLWTESLKYAILQPLALASDLNLALHMETLTSKCIHHTGKLPPQDVGFAAAVRRAGVEAGGALGGWSQLQAFVDCA